MPATFTQKFKVMTTSIESTAHLLVDTEFATIPYSEATRQLNEQHAIPRSPVPISRIETGKFRRLFNRHLTAFQRR